MSCEARVAVSHPYLAVGYAANPRPFVVGRMSRPAGRTSRHPLEIRSAPLDAAHNDKICAPGLMIANGLPPAPNGGDVCG